MKRFELVILICGWIMLGLVLAGVVVSTCSGQEVGTATWGADTMPVAPVADEVPIVSETPQASDSPKLLKSSKVSTTYKANRRLPGAERRRLGLTIPKLIQITRALKDAGEWDDLDPEGSAIAVLEQLALENPTAYADPRMDLDTILEWIEKIMPVILLIISLMS